MTTAEAIRNRIIKTELVDIDKLTPFQGKLKTLDDKNFNKLRKSILDEGFSFTVHVWENGGVTYIIDGHQRVSVLTQMRKQGIEVPPITCAFVSAGTYRDAKKLVLLAISQYGKIQKDGFLDFVEGEDFDFGDYDFPQLDFNLDELFPIASSNGDDDDDQTSDQPEDDEESESDPIDDLPVEVPSRVKSGDIYSLGDHVLVCGDSNNAALVHSVIAEDEADCIVTDPPYGLSFMGKEWDKGVPSKYMWETWISRIKPGAHVLSFSGTRTYHIMTTAIEAAGFEIRDMMQWLYGQGFPKSQDISKAIDKAAGAEREVVGIKHNAAEIIRRAKAFNSGAANEGWARPWREDEEKLAAKAHITAPATEAAKKFEGWGTALKPANEPICLARKPLSESTIAKNVLKHGTGGLNIDGARIDTNGEKLSISTADPNSKGMTMSGGKMKAIEREQHAMGRFPCNVILGEINEPVLIYKGTADTYMEGHIQGFFNGYAELPELREEFRRFSIKGDRQKKILQQNLLQPGSAEQNGGNSSEIRSEAQAGIHSQNEIETKSEGERSSELSGQFHDERLSDDSYKRSSGITPGNASANGSNDQQAIPARAQTGNGDSLGKVPAGQGDSSPQEWQESGQSARKSGNSRRQRSQKGALADIERDADTALLIRESLLPDLWRGYFEFSGTYRIASAAKVLDGQTGILKSGARKGTEKAGFKTQYVGGEAKGFSNTCEASEGGASRFFYVAKASKSDRGEGNTHATVKPISLMRYLVKLVTPTSGLVLEPFCGSGTTLLACEMEKMRCIGFELDPRHCDIILARWEGLTKRKAEKVN